MNSKSISTYEEGKFRRTRLRNTDLRASFPFAKRSSLTRSIRGRRAAGTTHREPSQEQGWVRNSPRLCGPFGTRNYGYEVETSTKQPKQRRNIRASVTHICGGCHKLPTLSNAVRHTKEWCGYQTCLKDTNRTYAARVVALPISLYICLSMRASDALSPFVKIFWPCSRGDDNQEQPKTQ